MKKKIIGIILPWIVAILFGFVCGKFVYSTYKDSIYDDLRSSKIYLIQNGKYDSYQRMREENSSNNYVYYQDKDGYNTVVGITRNYDNIEKIKELFSEDLVVNEYYVPIEYLDSKQDEYDDILYNTNDIREVKEIVDNILNLYRSDDSIRLVSIN